MYAEHVLPTPEEEDERERARTCSALDLRRVVPAPMAVGGLRISHLELYADGALLYSLELGQGPPPPPELLRVAVGPSERKGGVRVTAAELFTEFVRLWWHRTLSPEELAERDRERVLNEGNGPPTEWRRVPSGSS